MSDKTFRDWKGFAVELSFWWEDETAHILHDSNYVTIRSMAHCVCATFPWWHAHNEAEGVCSQTGRRKESDNKIRASPHSLSHTRSDDRILTDESTRGNFPLTVTWNSSEDSLAECKGERIWGHKSGNRKVESQQSSLNETMKCHFDSAWWKWNRLTASTTWHPRSRGARRASPPGIQDSLAETSLPKTQHSILKNRLSTLSFVSHVASLCTIREKVYTLSKQMYIRFLI